MSEVESQLSQITRKAVDAVEEKFPGLSKRYCPDQEGEFCRMTREKCEFESCPKMNEQLKNYL